MVSPAHRTCLNAQLMELSGLPSHIDTDAACRLTAYSSHFASTLRCWLICSEHSMSRLPPNALQDHPRRRETDILVGRRREYSSCSAKLSSGSDIDSETICEYQQYVVFTDRLACTFLGPKTSHMYSCKPAPTLCLMSIVHIPGLATALRLGTAARSYPLVLWYKVWSSLPGHPHLVTCCWDANIARCRGISLLVVLNVRRERERSSTD
ncbi:hypothetical protein V8C26DRAFT_383268 [Trichoderma gracile]